MAKGPSSEELGQRVKRIEREIVEGKRVAKDTSTHKQTEEMLRDSELRFRALADATFEAIFLSERGVCIETNHRATEMFGYDYDELIGIFGSDIIAPESKELVEFNMLTGYEEPYEAVAQRKDGTTFQVEICGKMTKYKGRDVRVTVVHDIDKRKRAETALRKSERRFRHLIEGSIQGVLIHRNLKPVFVNQAYADIFGYSITEILEMDTVLSQIASSEQDRLIGYMNARVKDEWAPTQYEYQGIKKDGSSVWLDNRTKRVQGWGKDAIQVTVFDITDRKQAEDALKKRSHELVERVKELNCLYGISKIIESPRVLGIEIFQRIVDIIPQAFQYPEIACACINIGGCESRTENFKETAWKLKSDIISSGKRIASLMVCYLEEKPKRYEGPFIKEERNLIDAIAQRLGNIVERLKVEKALRDSEEKLRYLSSSLLKAQGQERQRISFGLHDELGQDLAFLKIQLQSIENRLAEDQKGIKEECKSTQQLLDNIVENIRRISRGLSPTILQDLGLSATLKWMIQDFTDQTQINVSSDLENIDNFFSEEAQIIIYRIFQEALTNIRKHSRATHVSVSIKKTKNSVSFMVKDNGTGFDMQEVAARSWPEKGLGLTTMEERTRILGGPLERFSRKGQGAWISLTIPIDKKGGE
ncbi:hypothetical protein D3OALGA1CA_1650 [Olavius algarvensis associated proteobacterium Delta 3]|nr:hypothetical protein D3OALGA1CA_1650 [Olavius algarvensis associated proteobacterium Delta 3]